MMKKIRKSFSLLLILLMLVASLTGCGAAESSEFSEVKDFEKARIGIMTGSSHDGTARELFPDAERVYFSTVADMVLAVEQGKIDGYIEDAPFLPAVLWEACG